MINKKCNTLERYGQLLSQCMIMSRLLSIHFSESKHNNIHRVNLRRVKA